MPHFLIKDSQVSLQTLVLTGTSRRPCSRAAPPAFTLRKVCPLSSLFFLCRNMQF
jgi:hypothetical protein